MIFFNFRFNVRLKHFQAVDDDDTFTRACVNKLTSKWYLELNMFGLNANEITWKHVHFAHLFVHMFSLCPILLSRRVFFVRFGWTEHVRLENWTNSLFLEFHVLCDSHALFVYSIYRSLNIKSSEKYSIYAQKVKVLLLLLLYE